MIRDCLTQYFYFMNGRIQWENIKDFEVTLFYADRRQLCWPDNSISLVDQSLYSTVLPSLFPLHHFPNLNSAFEQFKLSCYESNGWLIIIYFTSRQQWPAHVSNSGKTADKLKTEFDELIKKCSDKITEMCKEEKETWLKLDQLEADCQDLIDQVETKAKTLVMLFVMDF